MDTASVTFAALARKDWLRYASHVHFGLCDRCGRVRDAADSPLLVARQERRRKFECFDCWDARR